MRLIIAACLFAISFAQTGSGDGAPYHNSGARPSSGGYYSSAPNGPYGYYKPSVNSEGESPSAIYGNGPNGGAYDGSSYGERPGFRPGSGAERPEFNNPSAGESEYPPAGSYSNGGYPSATANGGNPYGSGSSYGSQTGSGYGSGSSASSSSSSANARSPMVTVLCASQTKTTCYGVSGDPGAEEGNACGWSPMENRCGMVMIDEEGPEGDTCLFRYTKETCNGFSSMTEREFVCAWSPFTNACQGSVLVPQEQPEAGEGGAVPPVNGINMAPFTEALTEGIDQQQIQSSMDCMNNKEPNMCQNPCMWVGGNPGFCLHPSIFGGELKSTHKQLQENLLVSRESSTYLYLAASIAFFLGLFVSCQITKYRPLNSAV